MYDNCQTSGTVSFDRDLLNNNRRCLAIADEHSFSTIYDTPSGPDASDDFNDVNSNNNVCSSTVGILRKNESLAHKMQATLMNNLSLQIDPNPRNIKITSLKC